MSAECVGKFMDLTSDEAQSKALVNDSPCFAPVWDYFKTLLQTAQITNGNTDTLNLMANGVATIGTAWGRPDLLLHQGESSCRRRSASRSWKAVRPAAPRARSFQPTTDNLAAALLFMDEMLAPEHQAWKLIGFASRSPKTGLDDGMIPDDVRKFLLPAKMFAERQISSPNPIMSKVVRGRFRGQGSRELSKRREWPP